MSQTNHIKLKILYAVQATGNGHISRAKQIIPYLQNYGVVDVFLSGSNATLEAPKETKFTSKGLSLYYTKCGGLDYPTIFHKNSYLRALKEARELPIEKYDLIINDFDFITAQSCKLKHRKSIHLGHQASFLSEKTPRPLKKSRIGEFVYNNYCKTSHYLGFHFQSFDKFILPPIVKKEIVDAEISDAGHVTVYLPSYQQHCLEHNFKLMRNILFHWFLPNIQRPYRDENIIYFPINDSLFNESLISCHGLITGGGFETPAEALFLGKKLMAIPIRDHYEQKCNAAALNNMGIMTLDEADSNIFSQTN